MTDVSDETREFGLTPDGDLLPTEEAQSVIGVGATDEIAPPSAEDKGPEMLNDDNEWVPLTEVRTNSEEAKWRMDRAYDILIGSRKNRDDLNDLIRDQIVNYDQARRAAKVYGHKAADTLDALPGI